MNKDNLKGIMDDAAGRAKRQAGEWTGDTKAQVEGATQQVKGKVEKVWGNVKDAARDADSRMDDREGQHDLNEHDRNRPGTNRP